ncbi:hypothetical protein KR044_002162 [Drosophila immigrans]|nr:hypothetical protein KR044_002162 [Drosophila immigrans]
MRPFEKDSQSVVSKGRRKTKSKLAAPKTKTAAALIKRKNRNAKRRQQRDTIDNLCKEQPCQFVPVRRKPLGEYMNRSMPMPTPMQMQVPISMSASMPVSMPMTMPMTITSPSSPSMQGMRMSYAAAVQTGAGVKVMISPRLNKVNISLKSVQQQQQQQHSKGSKANNKMTADTKFRIFDEQPKPHIVRVEPKLFRADVDADQKAKRMKSCSSPFSKSKFKSKKPHNKRSSLKATSASSASSAANANDVDINALKLQFERLACGNAAGAVAFKGNSLSLSACDGQQAQRRSPSDNRQAPAFADSVSYFSFHQQRLQRIIDRQGVCAICLQSPEEMMIPQFEDKHFKYLEEAALLAQNRTMLRLWMNSDLLIS